MERPTSMDVSFVIPAHNEAGYIGRTVGSVNEAARSAGCSHEVIVVDDDSTDGTGMLAAALGARVVGVKSRQIARVRNAGARQARGDVLCFVDADTLVPGGTLAAALRSIGQGSVGGGALVSLDSPVPIGARCAVELWNVISRLHRWAAGCFIYCLPGPFAAVGGFDERFFASEEIELSKAMQRMGPFNVLSQRVMTSARKMSRPWVREMISLTGRMIVTGGRAVQQRNGLGYWYEAKRGEGNAGAESGRG